MDSHLPNKFIATKYCFLILGDDTSSLFFLSPSLQPPPPPPLSLSLFFVTQYLYTVFRLSAELIITRNLSYKEELSKNCQVTACYPAVEFEAFMASDAPEGGGGNAAVLGVNAGPLLNIHLKVDDPPTVRSLSSKVADALSFGLRAAGIGIGAAGIGIGVAATGVVITIGVLCYKHPEFVMRFF